MAYKPPPLSVQELSDRLNCQPFPYVFDLTLCLEYTELNEKYLIDYIYSRCHRLGSDLATNG
jgi:hypothetical protein